MSEDEIFALIASGVIALVAWVKWYVLVLRVRSSPGPTWPRLFLLVIPVAALTVILIALRLWAAVDVRDSRLWLAWYTIFGAAWLAVGRSFFPWGGVAWRDDALERSNPATAIAIGGAMLGLTACYAGANVGDGPGWWCVLWAGGLGTIAWLAAWYVLVRCSEVAEAVSVERDRAAGVRLSGYLIASGLICGRASAGDWGGFDTTAIEFADAGWPLLPLLVAAIAVERSYAPTPVRPARAWHTGVPIAVLWIALALVTLLLLGPSPRHPGSIPPPALER